jgi:hypothetical protein
MAKQNWTQFLADLAALMKTTPASADGDWTAFFAGIGKLIDDVTTETADNVAGPLKKFRAAYLATPPKTARDWAAFFQALVQALATILPLIAPYLK